jgi:mannose-6-phosphate isomerase-like protein (cupin superfamily)
MDTKQHAWGTYSAKVDKEKKVKIREIYVKPYEEDFLKYVTNKTEKWDVISGSASVETKETSIEISKGGYVLFSEEIIYKVKAGSNGLLLREVRGY